MRLFWYVFSCVLSVFFASLLVLSDTTRLDIYNTGAKENKIELIGRTEKVYPDWCKNDNGSCVVAEVRNYWFWLRKKVLIKTVGKGRLHITLMGQWHTIRNKKPKEPTPILNNGNQIDTRKDFRLFPQYVDYKAVTVDGRTIANKAKMRKLWHDNRVEWITDADDGQIFTLDFRHRYHPRARDYHYFILLSAAFIAFLSVVFKKPKASDTISSSVKKSVFLDEFDYFRGIAIFFIVLCHFMGDFNEKTGNAINIFNDKFSFRYWIAYEFQFIWGDTALFVFISGFLFYYIFYQRGFDYKLFLKNKFKNIISPYLVMCALLFVVRFCVEKQAPSYNKDWLRLNVFWYCAFWYIPFISVVFIASPFFVKFIQASPKTQKIVLSISLLWAVATGRNQMNPWLNSVFWSLYYLFGIYVAMRYEKFKEMTLEKFVMVALPFFVFVGTTFAIDLGNVWIRDYSSNAWKLQFKFNDLNAVSKMLQCLFVLACCILLKNSRLNRVKTCLHFLAKYSFSIFFLHCFGLYILNMHYRAVQAFLSGKNKIELHLCVYAATIAVCVLCALFAKVVQRFAGKRSRLLVGS